jgi:hypothetical protein
VYSAQGKAKFGGVGHGGCRVILGCDCVIKEVLSLSSDSKFRVLVQMGLLRDLASY